MRKQEVGNTNLRGNPTFIDGLTTHLSYLIIATDPAKSAFNCLCLRKISDKYKIKFYPTARAWGFSKELIKEIDLTYPLKREDYERFVGNARQIQAVLNIVREAGAVTVNPELLANTFENWDEVRSQFTTEPI